LLKLRRLDEAEQALAGAPPVPGVLASRGAIAEAKGETETAVQLAQEALQRAPDNRSARLILARIYLAQRKWDAALPVLEHMVDNAPYDHEARLLFGRALVGSGERDRGETEIQRATELKNTFLKFADLHQEAIKNPEDVAIRISLGQLAEKLGKPQLAENWYRAALGLDPGNKAAADALQLLNPPKP
jgi:tetratricopeptide (TPR) repeat protein